MNFSLRRLLDLKKETENAWRKCCLYIHPFPVQAGDLEKYSQVKIKEIRNS